MKKRLAAGLPDVIDCRDREDETPRFTVLVTADIRNRLAFEFEYRVAFEGGELGSQLQVRQIFADDYELALYRLRKLLAGFGVVKILLYRLRGPLTPAQIARVHDLNAELRRIKSNGKDTHGAMRNRPHRPRTGLPGPSGLPGSCPDSR